MLTMIIKQAVLVLLPHLTCCWCSECALTAADK
jgi:hypothetical protein